ncbi:MAG: hypothetical protein SGPRY_008749, partial [Prymnesium sp.]
GEEDGEDGEEGEEGGEEEGNEGDEDADANDDAEADEEKESKKTSNRKKKTKASNEDTVEEADQEILTPRVRMNTVRLTLLECMHAIFAQMSNAKCPNTSGSSQSSCTRAPS